MRSQKKTIPKIARHPGTEHTRDQQTARDVFPHRQPIHHEIMTRRSDSFGRSEPLPKRTTILDAHVHLGMAFHDAFNSFVRLLPRLSDELARKKNSEKHRDDHNHQRTAREFSEREPPSNQHDENTTKLGD